MLRIIARPEGGAFLWTATERAAFSLARGADTRGRRGSSCPREPKSRLALPSGRVRTKDRFVLSPGPERPRPLDRASCRAAAIPGSSKKARIAAGRTQSCASCTFRVHRLS